MAGQGKSEHQVLLDQLTKHVASLASEQKAKEAIVRELNEQVKIAERESAEKIAKVRADTEVECEALRKAVEPMKDLKPKYDQLLKDIAQLRNDKIIAVTDIKEARSAAIKEADAVLVKSAGKLTKIEQAIEECKRKVSAL